MDNFTFKITIDGEEYSIAEKCSIFEDVDIPRDSSSISLFSDDEFSFARKRNQEVIVEIEDRDFVDEEGNIIPKTTKKWVFVIGSDTPEVYSKVPLTWKHNLLMTEKIRLTEGIILGTQTYTLVYGKSGNEFESKYKNLLEQVQHIINVAPVEIESRHSETRIIKGIDPILEDKLRNELPFQTSITEPSLYEVLYELLSKIDAIPKLDENDILYADYFNDVGEIVDLSKDKIDDMKLSISNQNYADAIQSSPKNLVNDSAENITKIVYPFKDGWTTIRSVTNNLDDNTACLEFPHELYHVHKYRVMNPQGQILETTPFVLDESIYDTLSLNSFRAGYPFPAPQNTVYVSGNKIQGYGDDYKYGYAGLMTVVSWKEMLKSAKTYSRNYDFEIPSNLKDLLHQIEYSPRIANSVMKSHKEETISDNLFTLTSNQSERVNEVGTYGKNLFGQSQRAGNVGIEMSYTRENFKDMLPLQFKNIFYGGIIAKKREVIITKNSCTYKYEQTKDYNNLNNYVGLSKERRYSLIDTTQAYDRIDLYEDFCEISRELRTIFDEDGNEPSIHGLGVENFLHNLILGGDVTIPELTEVGNVLYKSDEIKNDILYPVDTKGFAGAINFGFKFNSPLFAGYKVNLSSYNNLTNIQLGVPYTKTPTDDLYEIQTYRKLDGTTNEIDNYMYFNIDIPETYYTGIDIKFIENYNFTFGTRLYATIYFKLDGSTVYSKVLELNKTDGYKDDIPYSLNSISDFNGFADKISLTVREEVNQENALSYIDDVEIRVDTLPTNAFSEVGTVDKISLEFGKYVDTTLTPSELKTIGNEFPKIDTSKLGGFYLFKIEDLLIYKDAFSKWGMNYQLNLVPRTQDWDNQEFIVYDRFFTQNVLVGGVIEQDVNVVFCDESYYVANRLSRKGSFVPKGLAGENYESMPISYAYDITTARSTNYQLTCKFENRSKYPVILFCNTTLDINMVIQGKPYVDSETGEINYHIPEDVFCFNFVRRRNK